MKAFPVQLPSYPHKIYLGALAVVVQDNATARKLPSERSDRQAHSDISIWPLHFLFRILCMAGAVLLIYLAEVEGLFGLLYIFYCD